MELQFTTTFHALLTFFEWRYYVMTRFFVVIAAVLAAWPWLRGADRALQGAVLASVALFSRTMALCDHVNAGHLRALYGLGARIESSLPGTIEPGVFATIDGRPSASMNTAPPRWWSRMARLRWIVYLDGDKEGGPRLLRYTEILRVLYNGTALVFLVCLVVVLVS